MGTLAAASARLIAAVPELVDVLAALLDEYGERGGPPVWGARAVLAKVHAMNLFVSLQTWKVTMERQEKASPGLAKERRTPATRATSNS